MISLFLTNPLLFFIIFPGLLAAIVIHEFAHAWVADKLGDPTPRYQDRVTLDPRAHLEPLGTAMILFTRFGWGKPVQFDPYNLKEPLRDTALIGLAGPASNIIFAFLLSLAVHYLSLPDFVVFSLVQIMMINVMLAVFNLVPVHPLDGSKIILPFLPKETAIEYEEVMRKYGMYILLFLILPISGTSAVSRLISPVIDVVVNLLLW